MTHWLTAAPSLASIQAALEQDTTVLARDFLLPLPFLFPVCDWDNLTNHFHQRPGPGHCLICGLGVLIPPLITWLWAGPFPCSDLSFPVCIMGMEGIPPLPPS